MNRQIPPQMSTQEHIVADIMAATEQDLISHALDVLSVAAVGIGSGIGALVALEAERSETVDATGLPYLLGGVALGMGLDLLNKRREKRNRAAAVHTALERYIPPRILS